MELRRQLNAFEVNICCEDCSKKPNPGCILKLLETPELIQHLIHPPKYDYQCPSCQKIITLTKLYPYIEHNYLP